MTCLPPEITLDALSDADGHAIEVEALAAMLRGFDGTVEDRRALASRFTMRSEWRVEGPDHELAFMPVLYLPGEL